MVGVPSCPPTSPCWAGTAQRTANTTACTQSLLRTQDGAALSSSSMARCAPLSHVPPSLSLYSTPSSDSAVAVCSAAGNPGASIHTLLGVECSHSGVWFFQVHETCSTKVFLSQGDCCAEHGRQCHQKCTCVQYITEQCTLCRSACILGSGRQSSIPGIPTGLKGWTTSVQPP